jgi:hypothetical protein
MNVLLSRRLLAAFPSLYADPNDPQRFGFAFAFQCGSGWFPLLYNLSQRIVMMSPAARASCVKEKFGTLSFYTHGALDVAWEAIEVAEQLSECTCEWCGQPGASQTQHGWLSTRCASCRVRASSGFDPVFDQAVAEAMLRQLDARGGSPL